MVAGSWRDRPQDADRGMTLLCPLPGCRLVRVARDGSHALIIVAEGQHDHARCPACRTGCTAVHTRYRRRAADLPASGKAVRLHLVVRRFYCPHPACPRRTFAERFPAPTRLVCPPHPPPQQGPGPDQSHARRPAGRPAAGASGYAGQRHVGLWRGSQPRVRHRRCRQHHEEAAATVLLCLRRQRAAASRSRVSQTDIPGTG
jgi:transposase